MPDRQPGLKKVLQAQGFKLRVLLSITALKLLLIPSYRSTDFEVHRNWLAITSSLPTEEWYRDTTSEWTLDYPPLFAWFEWLLAQVARLVDPSMLQVENLGYASTATVGFQRGSVILTDLVLASGAWYSTRRLSSVHSNVVFFLMVANPGLLIVDHIHFQYNGFLIGILIWSLGLAIEGHDLLAGLTFAALVNLKHLFASLGPLYFVYLLQHYCRGENGVLNFFRLGSGVVGVFALSFGPFIEYGQLGQVLKRLFPFGRGLCHAYWAPNAWALYAALDKAMVIIFKFVGIPVVTTEGNLTGGLVGASKFALMPDIPPVVPLMMLLLAMLPTLVTLWRNPNPIVFVKSVVFVALSSFMLGYHVHEKAILTAAVPAALGAVASRRAAGEFMFLSTVSTYSLFPLIFTAAEYPIKVMLLLTYQTIASILLSEVVNLRHEEEIASRRAHPEDDQKLCKQSGGSKGGKYLLGRLEALYLAGLVPLELYCNWIHPGFVGDRLPFLPLMLTSVYCAAGMVWIWSQQDVVEVVTTKQE